MTQTQPRSVSRLRHGIRCAAVATIAALAALTLASPAWAGDDQGALWWTERAVTLAAAGGDHDLAAYALVRRALVTLYHGDGPRTVGLAQQAQPFQQVQGGGSACGRGGGGRRRGARVRGGMHGRLRQVLDPLRMHVQLPGKQADESKCRHQHAISTFFV